MAIPKLEKQDILNALQFIDKESVPFHNESLKYDLVSAEGKRYPPIYVVAVANHLANGTAAISTVGLNAEEVRKFLKEQGFTIKTKTQEEYLLTITADSVKSTDKRFNMDNLNLGNRYKPLDTYFENANSEITERSYSKGERKNSNQTMPRLAFQIFEEKIAAMSAEDKENFPVCKYDPESEMIRGIFSSEEDFREKTKESTYGLLHYRSNENDRQFVIRSWNVFSTIYFVQECLKRFGEPGDKFVLRYCEKEGIGERVQQFSKMLTTSKNLILRGAPGTGKSYLAKQIAAYLVSGGTKGDCKDLSDTQKKQVEFVQFHPSYDYTDFVEGLRPKINEDGTMGFALQDGIFKKFVARARKSYEDHLKSKQKDPKKYIFIIDEINRGEISKIFGELFFAIDPGYRGNAGEISTQYANLHADPDEKFYIPDNMYIIGTMNDIDRSVDSFDFAMRRRFRFVEIKADDRLEMLASLEDDALEIEAIKRMTALNQEIARTEDLSESYQIGASYFLKLKELDFDQLWTDYLQPLLQEYIRGMYNEKEIMQRFEKAYEYQKPLSGDENDALQD